MGIAGFAGGYSCRIEGTEDARLAAGARRLEEGMVGHVELFSVIDGRRFPAVGAHEAEIALLLDPDARLGEDGIYPSA